jgi:hypothetical protein
MTEGGSETAAHGETIPAPVVGNAGTQLEMTVLPGDR